MADYNLSVDLSVSKESLSKVDSEVQKSLSLIGSEAEKIFSTKYTVKLDTTAATAKVRALRKEMQLLNSTNKLNLLNDQLSGKSQGKPNLAPIKPQIVPLSIDKNALSQINNDVKSSLNNIGLDKPRKINLDTVQATRQLDSLKQRLASLSASSIVPRLPTINRNNLLPSQPIINNVAPQSNFARSLGQSILPAAVLNQALGKFLSDKELSNRLNAQKSQTQLLKMGAQNLLPQKLKFPTQHLTIEPGDMKTITGKAQKVIEVVKGSIVKGLSTGLGGASTGEATAKSFWERLGYNPAMKTGRLANTGGDYELMLRRIMSFGGSGAISLLGFGGMAAGSGIIGHKAGNFIKERGGDFVKSGLDELFTAFGSNRFQHKKINLDLFQGMYKTFDPGEGLVKSWKQIRHEVEAIEKIRFDKFTKSMETSAEKFSKFIEIGNEMRESLGNVRQAESRFNLAGVDTSTFTGKIREIEERAGVERVTTGENIVAAQDRNIRRGLEITSAQKEITQFESEQKAGRKMSEDEIKAIELRKETIADYERAIQREKENIQAMNLIMGSIPKEMSAAIGSLQQEKLDKITSIKSGFISDRQSAWKNLASAPRVVTGSPESLVTDSMQTAFEGQKFLEESNTKLAEAMKQVADVTKESANVQLMSAEKFQSAVDSLIAGFTSGDINSLNPLLF